MNRLNVKVTQLTPQGLGNLGIRLESLHGEALPTFSAGSHVDVFIPGGLVRQYSIASAPSRLDHYELCVKKDSASRGGSRFLHESLVVGDTLEISLPRNLFALQPARHHVLVAAGIGITPLLSMAEALSEQGLSFSLHYYSRTPAEAAYTERLQALGGLLHHSDQGRSPRHHLPEDFQHPDARTRLYLCGPDAFMQHMTERAIGLGWEAAQIHREAFSARPFANEPGTDGAADGAFDVQLRSSGQIVPVAADQSIAQALQAARIEIPLSCEQGFCGACLTGVLEGTPCHRDSVLSDEEKSLNQQIALCCSRSVSQRLVLDL